MEALLQLVAAEVSKETGEAEETETEQGLVEVGSDSEERAVEAAVRREHARIDEELRQRVL